MYNVSTAASPKDAVRIMLNVTHSKHVPRNLNDTRRPICLDLTNSVLFIAIRNTLCM